MKRLALLLLALLLLAAPAAAAEVWEKSLGEEITAVATDERGDRIFVGTESGMLYCYNSAGSEVWSLNAGAQITEMAVDGAGDILMIGAGDGSSARIVDPQTGTVLFSHVIQSPKYIAISQTRPLGAHLLMDYALPTLRLLEREGSSCRVWAHYDILPASGLALSGDASWLTTYQESSLRLYQLSVPQRGEWLISGTWAPYHKRVAHTITGTTAALTNYPVEVTVIRGAGSSSGSTLYAPDCRADFNDIRFTAADGVTQIPYYLESVVGSTATFLVNVPSIPASPATATIYVYWANPAATTTTSDPDAQWIFYDDFEDGSINTSLWTVTTGGAGTVTETGGYLEIYASGALADYATVTGPTVSYPAPSQIIANVSFHEVPSYRERVRIPPIGGGDIGVFSDVTSGGQQLYWDGFTGYSTTLNTNQLLHAWWTPGGNATYTYGSDWNVTRSPAASSVSIMFRDGDTGAYYGGHTRIYDIGVTSYNSSVFFTRSWSSVESVVTPQDTKTLDGTIIDIDAPETGDWVAVSTTTKTYIIQITDSGFGTVYSADRTGTPYDLAIANNGANLIEGRGILADIFRFDGVQTGTYSAGGPVQHVALAQKNGLYAAAGSDDGKYYIFSKDESSAWYLLHASDSYDPVTALAMTWRGELLIVGRADGRLTAFQVSEQDASGTVKLNVFKDNKPYAAATLRIEASDDGTTWGAPITLTADSYGSVALPVQWGNHYRVTVGDEETETTLQASPIKTEYVIIVPSSLPVRLHLDYSTEYDPATGDIWLRYVDDEAKTNAVTFRLYRTADNALEYEETFSTIPAEGLLTNHSVSWTNSSYRVQMSAVRDGQTITNTWHQWVGADVAALPGELDDGIRLGIWFIVILFVAGLFSYLTGPQGAVVTSLLAAFLVLIGWLPLEPAVVALCVVWAFLGLLGRTSAER